MIAAPAPDVVVVNRSRTQRPLGGPAIVNRHLRTPEVAVEVGLF